ncbi:MAG TPA: 4'-phosphopantetheinyl transferase superfamily protein [Steroidobacteraceae bacterium]|jgi:4'-phosphopantetheinyl transferase
MLLPRPDEIHLWLVRCNEVSDAELLRRYREMLSAVEKDQEHRFLMPQSRHRYLLTRALVRTTLSRYAPLAARDWVFESDPHGRPRIVNQHEGVANLSFNISHTEDVVLLGMTADAALGVDVESVRARTPSGPLADRYFSPTEAQHLRALPPSQQQQRFFDYWTLKESYIKARGLGLSISLDQFSFRIGGGEIAIRMEPGLGDSPDRWRFWLLRTGEHHIAAICAQRTVLPQSLVMRLVVPLHSEQAFACKVLARSP